jgi:hypothetical protein
MLASSCLRVRCCLGNALLLRKIVHRVLFGSARSRAPLIEIQMMQSKQAVRIPSHSAIETRRCPNLNLQWVLIAVQFAAFAPKVLYTVFSDRTHRNSMSS